MKINSINSTGFGNSYSYGVPTVSRDHSEYDIETIDRMDDILKRIDTYRLTGSEKDKETPKKKSPLAVVTSVAIGTIGVFLITKKGINGINSFAKSIIGKLQKTDSAKKASEFVTSTKVAQNAMGFARGIDNKILSNDKLVNLNANVNKLGADNVIAGIAAIGTTGYVLANDRNCDGVPDVAQRGVKAYKDAVRHFGIVEDMIDLIS